MGAPNPSPKRNVKGKATSSKQQQGRYITGREEMRTVGGGETCQFEQTTLLAFVATLFVGHCALSGRRSNKRSALRDVCHRTGFFPVGEGLPWGVGGLSLHTIHQINRGPVPR